MHGHHLHHHHGACTTGSFLFSCPCCLHRRIGRHHRDRRRRNRSLQRRRNLCSHRRSVCLHRHRCQRLHGHHLHHHHGACTTGSFLFSCPYCLHRRIGRHHRERRRRNRSL